MRKRRFPSSGRFSAASVYSAGPIIDHVPEAVTAVANAWRRCETLPVPPCVQGFDEPNDIVPAPDHLNGSSGPALILM